MSNSTPWVPLTVTDLLSSMTSKERTDFAKISVEAPVEDRALPTLVNLVQEIRGYIGSHPHNTMSADETLIPSEFVAKALAIARWRVLTTIPGYQPGDARELEYEKADSFFNSVAKGTIRPRPASDAVPNPVPDSVFKPSPRISARKRRFSRADQDGI